MVVRGWSTDGGCQRSETGDRGQGTAHPMSIIAKHPVDVDEEDKEEENMARRTVGGHA